jgi:hypothetical protein
MHLTLSDGREAKVWVTHTPYEEAAAHDGIRVTHIEVETADSVYAADAVCSKKDQFQRSTGRRLAAIRLLKVLQKFGWNKADRQAVFRRICPEYAPCE